jgi:hypothetical protein
MAEKLDERRWVKISEYSKKQFPKRQVGKSFVGNIPSIRPGWTNEGLYAYSQFMATSEFMDATENLIQRGQSENIGIMCSEVLWRKCHRGMIADYLVWHNVDVIHLQPELQHHADVIGTRLNQYDSEVVQAWEDYNCKIQ